MVAKNFSINEGIEVGIGGSIITTTTGGNVGIGSTNPSSKLCVVGDLNLSGVVTAKKLVGGGKEITNNTGIYTGIIVSNDSSKVIAAASTINFISTQFDIKFNSGITTVSHNLKNSVYTLNGITGYSNTTNQAISVGNINSSGIITANFFQGTGSEIRNIPGTLLEPYSNNSDISYSTFSLTIGNSLFSDKNGNIGIGSTKPTSKLSVVGNGKFTGIVTANVLDGVIVGIITATTGYASTSEIATYSQTSGIATYATTAGIATIAQGLSGQTLFVESPFLITSNNITVNGGFNIYSFSASPSSLVKNLVYSTSSYSFGDIINDVGDSSGGFLIGSSPSYGATMTSSGNVSFAGIVTASGGFNLGIQSSGINVSTGVITSINFSGSGVQSVSFDSQNKKSNIIVSNIFQTRKKTQITTSSISVGATENLSANLGFTYILYKVGVSTGAWVRIYTDSTSRSLDASRLEITEPNSGSGVISEIITTKASTILITPGTIGFSVDSNTSYLAVTNKGSTAQSITVTLEYLPLKFI